MKDELKLLIGIILFGTLFRLWNLGANCFFVDEWFTYKLVQQSYYDLFVWTMWNDCHPPLFYLLVKSSLDTFGQSVVAERLPSVISGILLIPATYLLGKEFDGERLGLLSAAVVATSGSLWYYSQFGRSYMLMCLVFTLSVYVFLRLQKLPTQRDWVLFVLLSAVSVWIHLFAVIPIGLLWLALLYQYRIKAIPWLAGTVVLSLPLMTLVWSMLVDKKRGTAVGASLFELVFLSPLEYFGFLYVLFVPLIAYATYQYRKARLLVGVCVLTFIIELGLTTITDILPRYLMLLTPVLMVIGMYPLIKFWDDPAILSRQKWFVVGVLVIGYAAITWYQFNSDYFVQTTIYCL